MKQRVRLSQCMIVKNEEENIRQALSWAKDIAFEQIVVDTGSTDRTVEIAEEMGAKVCHFQWIDDFSAAKNYAIEQASGNWIAFLDADEYMETEAAAKLLDLLERIEATPKGKSRPNVIRQPWLQLTDMGTMFASSVQDRVFQNKGIRYKNRIHEYLIPTMRGQKLTAYLPGMEMPIYHTGYTKEAYAKTQKARRNIDLLEKELKEDPENYVNWGYLGDSYLLEDRVEDAISAWKKCVDAPEDPALLERRIGSAGNLMRLYLRLGDRKEELEELYHRFSANESGTADLEYWMGCACFKEQQYEDSIAHLAKALSLLETDRTTNVFYCSSKILDIYSDLIEACQACGKVPEAVRFATLSLNMKARQENILTALLGLFQRHGEQAEGVLSYLEKLYDFADPRDTLFVLKSAKLASFSSLEELLMEKLDEKTKKELTASPERWDFYEREFPPLLVRNSRDAHFARLAQFLKIKTEEELLSYLKLRLNALREENEQNYQNYCRFYQTFPFWGALAPQEERWNAFTNRIHSLKERLRDWIHFYENLADHRSRQTVIALLENWINLDHILPAQTKDYGCPYFDLDLIPSAQDVVLVDAGAHRGETVQNFLKTYGEGFRRIYTYECNPSLLGSLKETVQPWEKIVLSTSAVGKQKGYAELVLCPGNDNATTLWRTEGMAENSQAAPEDLVSVAPLDEDIREPISLLKLNVCGMEADALSGARRHILQDRPVIAAAAFYQYDELLTLFHAIRQIEPNYRFYLRHYGENLIMTDYVLYAIYPDQAAAPPRKPTPSKENKHEL